MEETRKPFRFMSIQDIMQQPDLEWLAEQMIPRKSLCVLYGPPGSCKSFLALSLSLSLAHGEQWRGSTQEKKAVLYIAAEGAAGMKKRIMAWHKHHGISLVSSHFILVPDTVNLLNTQGEVDQLIEQIREYELAHGVKFELIIVDTLARSMAGADENSSAQMALAIDGAEKVQKAIETAILLVHHCGKDESRGARGSNALKGAVDAELSVKRDGDSISVKLEKMKDAEDGIYLKFEVSKVELGNDSYGKPMSSLVMIPRVDDMPWDEYAAKVIATILDEGTHSFKQVIVAADLKGLAYKSENIEKLIALIGDGRIAETMHGTRSLSISGGKVLVKSIDDKPKTVTDIMAIRAKEKMTGRKYQ